MQADLQEFLLLGAVPGTNIEFSLEAYIIMLCVLFLVTEIVRAYVFYHYSFRAKLLDKKAQKLLKKHGLA